MVEEINISYETYLDMVNIKDGVFHPLDRFMNNNDLTSVVSTNHLENGDVWPMHIIQTIDDAIYPEIVDGEEYNLLFNGSSVGTVIVDDKYRIEKEKIANLVFKTSDKNHPGVNSLFKGHNYAISGKLKFFDQNLKINNPYYLTPKETKEKIKQMGWRTVVGFGTRNIPHLAHEYLQRCGLEMVDGLFIQPQSGGWNKVGSFKTDIVFECYKELIDNYYPKNRVMLSSLSTYTRYGGPREALFQAMMRRNFGCTHFIIGRDHAGVGNYYGKYDSHKIFDSVGDIGITPLLLYEPFYCKKCEMMATEKTCPHEESQRIQMSGTYIRNLILNNGNIPREMLRKEIAKILKGHLNKSEFLIVER